MERRITISIARRPRTANAQAPNGWPLPPCQICGRLPQNLVVMLTYARQLASADKWQVVDELFEQIRTIVNELGRAAAQAELDSTDRVLKEQDGPAMERGLTRLRNALHPTPSFRKDLAELQPPVPGLPITQFSPPFRAKIQAERPRHVKVRFTRSTSISPSDTTPECRRPAAGSLDVADIDSDGRDEVLVGYSNGQTGHVQLWQNNSGNWVLKFAIQHGAVQTRFVDFNNDDNDDIVTVRQSGLSLLEGRSDGQWTDTTTSKKLESSPANAIELMDADNEGDLDVVVAGTQRCQLWQAGTEATLVM